METESCDRKRLTASLLEQRYKTVHSFYNSIPDHQFAPTTVQENHHHHHLQQNQLNCRAKKLNQQKFHHNCNNLDSIEEHRNNNDTLNKSNFFSKNQEMAIEVKKRLSLPLDTSIPDSFLNKHKGYLFDLNSQPLSRIARRRSLFEIGFGQLSSYTKSHVLGAGTYSTVYKGTSRLTNKLVALKEIHLENDEGVPFTAIREVSLLKELRHANIITLHDIIYTKKTLTLVFEYVDRDLSQYMDECHHKIETEDITLFLYQLLRGLKYCHDRRILHRDLKPQNILISSIGELKLADFGLARAMSVPTKTLTDEVVTLWYRPPDVLLGNTEYSTSIDMWGVGCIFFEMAAGYTLFTGTSPQKQIRGIFEIVGTPDADAWPGLKYDLECYSLKMPHYSGKNLKSLAPRLSDSGIDLMHKFLKCNPRYRISAKEAMFHVYFHSLPREIHNLDDSKSIFSISSVRLSEQLHNVQFHNVTV